LDSNEKEYFIGKKEFYDFIICNLNEKPMVLFKDDFSFNIYINKK